MMDFDDGWIADRREAALHGQRSARRPRGAEILIRAYLVAIGGEADILEAG